MKTAAFHPLTLKRTEKRGTRCPTFWFTGFRSVAMHVVRRNPVEFSAHFMMQNQQLPVIYIGVQSE